MTLTMAMVTSMSGCGGQVVSVEEVEKMINEQVPVGSDKMKVKAFIDNFKVDALKITRGNFYKPTIRPVGLWDEERITELWERVLELINARIIDAKSSFLNRNDIFIEFAIDRDGRMIGYSVKMIGTE